MLWPTFSPRMVIRSLVSLLMFTSANKEMASSCRELTIVSIVKVYED